MNTTITIILIAAALLVVLLIIGYNSLVMLRNKVNEAFATMDVSLKKRFDLIPTLVEVVKGYAAHESATLQEVTEKRKEAANYNDRKALLNGEAGISKALGSIFAVVEAYPELKANNSFLTLQQQLAKIEDEIALSRRYYNGSVREYNNRCQVVPFNIIARLFNFKAMPMFAIEKEEERQTVSLGSVFTLLLLLMGSMPASADLGGFYYDKVHVDAVVHENNVWDITERFEVVFTSERHGIYRYIPSSFWLWHDISGDKDYKADMPRKIKYQYESDIEDMRVDGWQYRTENKDDNYVVRIGDEDEYVSGRQTYVLHYKYIYREDRRPDHDYLFHTILGTDFKEPINLFSFRISFDKPLPEDIATRLKVYSGEYGNEANVIDSLALSVSPTIIEGKANHVTPLHGITLYAQLPQGYYKDVLAVNPTVHRVFLWIWVALMLLIGYYLLRTKRNHVTKVIEFYPPEGISSAEVGTIIDDAADLNDVTSLIPWLAGQGYLHIREIEGNKKTDDLELTRLKDLPDDAPAYQKKFMKMLFSKGDVVKMKDLGERPNDIQNILLALSRYFKGKRKLVTNKWQLLLYIPLGIAGTMTLATNSTVMTFYGIAFLWALLCYGVPFAVAFFGRLIMSRRDLFEGVKTRRTTFALKLVIMAVVCYLYVNHFIDYGAPMGWLPVSIIFATSFLIVELTGHFCVDSPYRVQMMGRLLGFKEFIETAEKDRLTSLQTDDPQYFYRVLPYAMVFGLSEKWSDLFKDINVEEPDWYESSTPLTGYLLTRNITHSLYNTANNAITIISHDSSSHGSGGGFSGGGGGGGGGGSW